MRSGAADDVDLNFSAGANIPNQVSALLSPDGEVCISGNATTRVLADVAGYTSAEPGTGFDIVLTDGCVSGWV